MGAVVAAELRAEVIAVARNAPERDAEQALAHPPAVEGRGVDEVHAQVEGHLDRAEGFVEIDARNSCPSDEAPKLSQGSCKPVAPSGRNCIGNLTCCGRCGRAAAGPPQEYGLPGWASIGRPARAAGYFGLTARCILFYDSRSHFRCARPQPADTARVRSSTFLPVVPGVLSCRPNRCRASPSTCGRTTISPSPPGSCQPA